MGPASASGAAGAVPPPLSALEIAPAGFAFDVGDAVAAFAGRYADAAAALRACGIDPIADAALPLAAACRRRGRDADAMLAALAIACVPTRAPAEPAPSDVAGLIELIRTRHHGYLRAELPRLGRLAALLAGDPAMARAGADLAAFSALLTAHIDDEERRVFPACLAIAERVRTARDIADLRWALRDMDVGHELVAERLPSLQGRFAAWRAPPALARAHAALRASMAAVADDLVVHARLEEHDLRGALVALLARG